MKRLLSVQLLLMHIIGAIAQITLSGVVTDKQTNEPLFGASILVKGTTNGTVTDIDGNYVLNNVSEDARVVFSYMGYTSQELALAGRKTLNVALSEYDKLLNDVVVVGYGVQRKSDVTGSVASIKADDLKGLSTSDAAAALQGKVSGVQIINSGGPGGNSEIRVRGYSSNSGDIGPLLIVDGLKVDNIHYLAPSLIESVEILKDAASAAIYGAEAGNGVVLITTKQASRDAVVHITYSAKYSLQSLGKRSELFNAASYIDYQKYIGTLDDEKLQQIGYNGEDTDWYDEVFGNSWTKQHDISIQGGNKKGGFLVSLNWLDDNGIVRGDKDVYKRLTGQINADYDFYKWLHLSSKMSLDKWKRQAVTYGEYSFLTSVVTVNPLTPPYYSNIEDTPVLMQNKYNENPGLIPRNPDHNNDFYGTSKIVEEQCGNPLWQRDRNNARREGINVRGSLDLNIKPFEGLVLTSRLGYHITQSTYHNYETPYWLSSLSYLDNYSITAATNNGHYYQWENFANYQKTFASKHAVGLMAGMSYSESHQDNTSVTAVGAEGKEILSSTAPNFQYIDYLLPDVTKTTSNAPSMASQLSYFGRATYTYDDRYSLQFNFRADAFDLSKLSKKQRWGYFPSLSAGWTVSHEKWFRDIFPDDIVSFIRLRGSWGENGNVNVLSNYRYASSIAVNQSFYQYHPETGDGVVSFGSKPVGLANPDLKWETSEQLDFGMDARFLNNRLSIGIDWYRKITHDLLIDIIPLPEYGAVSQTINAGKVMNRGFDFEVGWRSNIGKFSYSINANLSTLTNEVKDIPYQVDRIEKDGAEHFNSSVKAAFEKGYPVWYFLGYKYAGVNPDTGAPLYYDKDGNITSALSSTDRQYIGKAFPDLTYGITVNMAWKGFDFTVFGIGATGNDIHNITISADRPRINGIDTYWKDSWRKPGDNAKYPDMKQVAYDWQFYSSSATVFSGAYFKFKQIQLGYTLPQTLTKSLLINSLRVSVSFDDYFIITSYPGTDPETASLAINAYSRGFDTGSYPSSRKVVFGLDITF